MSIDFSKFKSRYIFLDYLFVSILIVPVGSLLSFIFGLSATEVFKPFTVTGNIIYIIFFTAICALTVYRLKLCRVEIKQILGNWNINRISWVSLLIIFYGEHTLTTGIHYLEYYFANLISPELIESTLNTLTAGSSQNDSSLAYQLVHYLLLMFVLVVAAPLTEEFIFRGVFLHRWAVKWGVIWSIILSSLLFGAIHRDIFWFSRAVGSVFIALYYIQTKTLLIPILMHAFNNGLVFIDLIFNHFDPNNVEDLNITIKYVWHGLLNIGLAVPILVYFIKMPKSIKQFPYFRNKLQEINNK